MPNTENTLLHKNPSAGHGSQEVHLCHRCGWPFPNPHPSAKHRRAHKKVCGTIEGFAITQPKSDDEEHDHSDDDNHHTPGPVIEKTNSKESGISGVGKWSTKSEDDVFTDAITEFSDGASGVSPQSVDKIVENKSVDETAEKPQPLNGSTIIGQLSDSGAKVDSTEHPEGITLPADPKAEPVSVEQCKESQPDLIISETPREVAVDTNVQTGEDKVAAVSLDSDEAKTSDHVTEVVNQDPSELATTLEEVDIIKEDVNISEEKAYAEEPLKCASENGGGDATTLQKKISENGKGDATISEEKIDSAMQLAPSTDSPCDLDSGEKPLEQLSKSDSSLLESKDNDSKKPSEEQTCDIQVKSDVKQVEAVDIQVKSDVKQVDAVDIAETAKESTPVDTSSETLTDSCVNEVNGTGAEVSTGINHNGDVAVSSKHVEEPTLSVQEPSLLDQKCSKEASSGTEERTDEDVVCAEPTGNDKTVASENFSFTPPPLISATSDDNGGVVTVDSKSVPDKSDIKITKENGGSSTVDLPSHSIADGMEGICSSVSAETDLQETKTTTEKCDSQKSDNLSVTPPPLISATGDDNGKVVCADLKYVQDESDIKLTKENGGISKVDPSNHSTATSDSMDVNCSSMSETDFQETKSTTEKCESKKSDDFEPPSFVTLVKSGDEGDKVTAASEIETVQNNQELKSDALQAAWFPSLTNVVNESEGRKKNEEKIAKVTNWSPGRQHGPLKNLLNDAKSPNGKQIPATEHKVEEPVKDNGNVVTKENCAPNTKPSKEMDKEWDSPARYPIEIKKEKKKGKSFWMPFACCSSVHREL